MTAEAALPPLYASWLRVITGGPIPAETKATCDHCAMLSPADSTSQALYFHPVTKCCAYQPHLPNFLAGRILSESDASMTASRKELERRIDQRTTITPGWAGPGGMFSLIYRNTPDVFGRAPELRCHFLTATGNCGIWKHRPGVCATWFCKHVRGETGFRFWKLADKLLRQVECELSLWCLAELETGISEGTDSDFGTAPHVSELGGEIDWPRYRQLWGDWAGRESDFYRACARLVDALTWEQVQNICGPRVRILADLLRDAYAHLTSDALPERLRLGGFRISGFEDTRYRIIAYSSYDPLLMPEALTHVLHYFDGRPTDEALESILRDHNLRIDVSLLRRMVDFGILAACSDRNPLPILT